VPCDIGNCETRCEGEKGVEDEHEWGEEEDFALEGGWGGDVEGVEEEDESTDLYNERR
jgi:hypothetical protein